MATQTFWTTRVSVIALERAAMETGEASFEYEGRTLRVRGFRQINGDHMICDYAVDHIPANRGDAISFVATGKMLRERNV